MSPLAIVREEAAHFPVATLCSGRVDRGTTPGATEARRHACEAADAWRRSCQGKGAHARPCLFLLAEQETDSRSRAEWFSVLTCGSTEVGRWVRDEIDRSLIAG